MLETVSVAEAATSLGVNKKKIRELIKHGQLPALKLGGSKHVFFRIRAEDLNVLFKSQKEAK
jgi:excisionase family DNA binding protein